MRHRIAHDYDGVDFRIVWQVVSLELQPLIDELEHHIIHLKKKQIGEAKQPPSIGR